MKSLGFTLMETIIYLAITSIILTSLISVTYQILDNGRKLEERMLALEEADFLIHKINWGLNELSDTDDFRVEEGSLMYREGGGAYLPLNSSAVKVSDLIFKTENTFIRVSFKVDDQLFETVKYFQ